MIPLSFRDVLFDGQERLSRRTAIERHGARVVRIAEIAEALSACADEPRPLRTPKRIFLSYKWGNKKHNQWVQKLVKKLKARGNRVTFDGQDPHARDRDIAQLVGSMIACHYFLIVMEPDYVDAVKSSAALQKEGKMRLWKVNPFTNKGVLDRGWVYDEYHTCMLISDLARITPVGLLKNGKELTEGMMLYRPQTEGGNVFDVSNDRDIDAILDQFFSNENPPPAHKAKIAATCIHKSEIAFECSEFSSALRFAKNAVDAVPSVAETHRCKAVAELAIGKFRDAAKSAMQALQLEEYYSENRYMLALAFVGLGRPDLALQLCKSLRAGVKSWRLSTVLGIAAWCAEQPIAAVNHIDFACSLYPTLRRTISLWHKKSKKKHRSEARVGQSQIEIIERAGKHVRGLRVLQLNESRLEPTSIIFDGQFPEKRSAESRDRLIESFAAHHLPATDMDSLNFMIKGQTVGPVRCSQCPARLPVIEKCDLLCFDCGIMLNGGIEKCPGCEGDALVPLIHAWRDSGAPCPYCREGVFRPLEVGA